MTFAAQGARACAAIATVAIVCAFATSALRLVGIDSDVWFHMTVGREVARLLSVPPVEFYLFPILGEPGTFFEWGFGLLAFLVKHAFGTAGLSIANSIAAGLVVFILLASSLSNVLLSDKTAQPNPSSATALLSFAAAAVFICSAMLVPYANRFNFRPEIALYVHVAVSWLACSIAAKNGSWKPLAAIPVSLLILAQLHPSALIAGVLSIANASSLVIPGGALFNERDPRATAKGFSAFVLACLLLPVANPYGISQSLLPFSMLGGVAITEFQPMRASPLFFPFTACLVVFFLSMAKIAPKRPVEVASSILLAFLAYSHLRNGALFCIFSAPLAIEGLAMALSGRRAALVLAASAGSSWGAFIALSFAALSSFGVGSDDKSLPLEAAAMMAKLPEGSVVANSYMLGGYLSFAANGRHLVHADGRVHGAGFSRNTSLFSALPGWDGYLDRIKAAAVVSEATDPTDGFLIPLVAELADNPDWALVLSTPGSLVFMPAKSLPPWAVPIPNPVSAVLSAAKAEMASNIEARGGASAKMTANSSLILKLQEQNKGR